VSRTRIHVAVGLSLLAHGMLAAIPISHRQGDPGLIPSTKPLIARLIPARVPEALPAPETQPEIPAARTIQKPVPARPRPEPRVAAHPPAESRPAPPAMAPAVPAESVERAPPQFDMLAAINARRERRAAFEEALRQREEALSAPRRSSPSESALANINRNLQSMGSQGDTTGGVFTILSMGTRTGEFSFNGWQPDRRWREVIEVDAGQGGNLERAMVRRMIELIRSHYDGDFVWRSHRLGKSIVLSARQQDGAGLEEFLVREFFGTPTLGHAMPRGR
jgi:hypothetical protein